MRNRDVVPGQLENHHFQAVSNLLLLPTPSVTRFIGFEWRQNRTNGVTTNHRTETVFKSISPRLPAIFLATSVISGCQVDGTGFRMDSNSRVPFFGFQLSSAEDPAAQEPTGLLIEADGELPAGEPDPGESKLAWGKLFDWSRQPRRIPLPRTDLQVARAAAPVPATFAERAGEF